MAETDDEIREKLERHNATAKRLLDEIIIPMVDEGASNVELVMLVETVAVGVIAYCLKMGLNRACIQQFTHNVARRLNDEALKAYLAEAPPEGIA